MDETQQVPADPDRPAAGPPPPATDRIPLPSLPGDGSATGSASLGAGAAPVVVPPGSPGWSGQAGPPPSLTASQAFGAQSGSQAFGAPPTGPAGSPPSGSQAFGSQSGSQAFGSQTGSQAFGSQSGSQAFGAQTGSQPAAPGAAVPAAAGPAPDFWHGILKVAWIAIALGFVIEVLLIALAAASGPLSSLKPFAADLVQKVSWSFLVCVGLAFGTAATKARPQVMGLLGLLAAPLAFNVARILHKGAGQALSVAADLPPGVAPYLIGLLKALEYGVLGWAIGQLGRRGAGIGAHLGAGLAIGVTFGVGIVAATGWMSLAPSPLAAVLGRGINEVLFPIGCSLALYAANVLGKRAAG